jgi:hypothetical protein
MDSNMMTATAAALGSLVGAGASIATTWITQRKQALREDTARRIHERETLYGEFITEASRLVVDALAHSLERPETFVKLYGTLCRIRLVSGEKILAEAEECCRRIVDLYAKPNMTTEQIITAIEVDKVDPLKAFSCACRAELLEIASGA